MGGGDRLRLKTAAQAMGMDPNEVVNMVFEKARRDKLAPEINRLGVSDEIKKLLSNVSQLDENGNGYVSINGKKTSLQEAAQMNPEELERILRTQNNSDSDNISEIAESVLSIKDNVEGWTKSFEDMMASSLEKSGIGDNFGSVLKGEASTSEIMARFADDYLKASQDKIEYDKQVAYWNKKYAEATNEYEKESAKIQMQQALYGKISAEQSLRSAEYALRNAEIAAQEAPLQTKQMEWQLKQTKEFAMDEAKVRLAQLNLTLRQAKFREEVQIPLQQEQLNLDYRKAKRIDSLYEIQRASFILQATSILADVANPVGKLFENIPFIGNISKWIGALGVIPAGWNIIKNVFRGGLDEWSKTEANLKIFTGADTRNWDMFKPDLSGTAKYASNFDPRKLSNSYATGGLVRGDRRFYDGGMLSSTDSFGGLLIGPTHADGGIKIEAQGGEYIMPREQTSMYYGILEAMRNKSFPTGNGGFNSMSVSNNSTSIFSGKYWGENPSYNGGGEPLRLDVSGTITLDLSGSTANIDAEDLLREPLLSQLVAAISRSQNNYMNYGVASETNLFSPWRQ